MSAALELEASGGAPLSAPATTGKLNGLRWAPPSLGKPGRVPGGGVKILVRVPGISRQNWKSVGRTFCGGLF